MSDLIELLYWAYQQDLTITLTEAGGMVWVRRHSKILIGESLGTGNGQEALQETIKRAITQVRWELEEENGK
jgi:hypothetical protein